MKRLKLQRGRLICLLIVIQTVLASLYFGTPANAGFIIARGGTWLDNKQGTRFSVFNLVEGKCEASLDVLYEFPRNNNTDGSWTALSKDIRNSRRVVMGCGCKLEYLMEYTDSVEKIQLKTAANPREYLTNRCRKEAMDSSESMNSLLTPMRWESSSNGVSFYDDDKGLSDFLKGLSAASFQDIIINLGFYFYPTEYAQENFTYLSTDYIVVIEPIFWFNNIFRKDGPKELFYGTPTEWAIYSEDTKSKNNKANFFLQAGNKKYSGKSIHSVMGNLTCVAGPLTCTPQRNRVLTIGENAKTIEIRSFTQAEKKEKKNWFYKNLSDPPVVDKAIFEELGVDYLSTNELYDLSVELVSDSYHTDTDSMLSFKLQTNGEVEFLPNYADVQAGDDYYGIKLVLETLPDSELQPDNVELTCDGIPRSGTDPFVTSFIYDDWHTPASDGEWKFAVHAYSPNGRLSYKSRSGTVIDPEEADSDYFFSIRVEDLRSAIAMPGDTNYDDKAPKDFTAPSGEINDRKPVTTAKWNTYEAVKPDETDGEGGKVVLVEKEYTKTAAMDIQPRSYGNVLSESFKEKDGISCLVTKSGYGIGIRGSCVLSGEYADADGIYQNGVVLFPEFGYTGHGSLVEPDGEGGYCLEKNPFSKYCDDIRYDVYSRVHFTPIWYPDGEYNIQVYMFDCWTPAGMLWDCATYTVLIDGTIYDDWYVTRR